MPTINNYVDTSIDVSIDDFLSECSIREIDELVQALIDDGHINESQTIGINRICYGEDVFEKSLNKLHGKWGSLNSVEEEIINKIANRF